MLGTNIGATDDDKKPQQDKKDSTQSEQIVESADSTLSQLESMNNRLDSLILVMEKLNEKK